jgi:hypothetical protein
MEKNWFILIVLVIVVIALVIILLKRNHKDRKNLFKKMPGDLPDPPTVKSEFDS